MSSSESHFLVSVIGDSGVGKTTFLRRFTDGKFKTEYTPTVGTEIHNIMCHTSRGVVNLRMLDFAGKDFSCISDFSDNDAAIVMIDGSSTGSHNFQRWADKIKSSAPTIPSFLCVNKEDLGNVFGSGFYYSTSAKNNNDGGIFLRLCRELMRDSTLVFIDPTVHDSSDNEEENENKFVRIAHTSALRAAENQMLIEKLAEMTKDIEELKSQLNHPTQTNNEEVLDSMVEYWREHGQSAKEILERSKREFEERDRIQTLEQEAEEKLYCWPVIVRSSYDEYQVHAICSSEIVALECMEKLATEILPGTMTGLVFVNKIAKNSAEVLVYNDDEDSICGRMLIVQE